MSSNVRIRKNVSNLNVGEKDKFVNAVLALKETPSKIILGILVKTDMTIMWKYIIIR